jgi:hypothetical protein
MERATGIDAVPRGRMRAVVVGFLLSVTVSASCAAAGNRVAATSPAPPGAATAALTSYGLTLARFEATLRQAMGQRPMCTDNRVTVALRFVVCGSPAARYAGYTYIFRGKQAPPFSLTRIAPSPGSYGVTATPVQIGRQYLVCAPKRYVLRLYASSLLLVC